MARWTNLRIRAILKEAFDASYEAKKVELIKVDINNRSKYVNDILAPLAFEELDGDRFQLKELDQEAIVRDRYLRKDFDVVRVEGKLFCRADNTDDCIHVFYVKQHPKVKGK